MKQDEDWRSFKKKYKIGQSVSGKRIHKAQFGVFLDIGEDFLCLLEIIEMRDLNYNLYMAEEEMKIGDIVEGKVGEFTDNNRRMRITQKNRVKK